MSTLPKRMAASYARAQFDAVPSVEDQHAENARCAAEDGFIIAPGHRFHDIGSGIDSYRPGLQALLRTAEEGGNLQRLYVTDRPRLGRSADPKDHWALLGRLEAAGVELIVGGEPPLELVR